MAAAIEAGGHLLFNTTIILNDGANELGTIALVPEFEAPEPETAPTLSGVAYVGDHALDSGRHGGIVIHAYTGGTLVTTAQTDENGQYAFSAAKTDFRLVFSKDGYVSQELNVAWSDDLSAFRVNAELLTEYAGVSLQADRTSSVSGQLSTTIVDYSWVDDTVLTLVGMGEQQTTAPLAQAMV